MRTKKMVLLGKLRTIQAALFLLLLVALLPTLAIQAYIYYDRFTARRAEVFEANLEVARALGRTFDAFIKDVLDDLLAVGMAATSSTPPSSEDLVRLLERSAKENPAIRNFRWIGMNGLVLDSSGEKGRRGIEPSEESFVSEPPSGREWVVSDLIASEVTGEPIFRIVRAFRGERGELLGIASAVVDPDRLKTVLAIKRTRDAAVSLLDSNGTLVFRYPPRENDLEQHNLLRIHPAFQEALEGRETVATFKSERTGKKRLVGISPIPSFGWIAAASRTEDEAMGPIVSRLIVQGSLFLLVTLSAFTVAFVLSRSLSFRIGILRDQAVALGKGEMQNLVIAPGPSEIVELAESFNKMAENVRDREEVLRDKERRLRAIFESTEEAIITVDDAQRCLEANPAAGVITGVRQEQLVGRSLQEIIDPVFDFSSKWEGFVKIGRFHEEVRVRHSSGSLRIVEASGVANIGPGRHLFVCHDITERKEAEEALRESEQKYRALHAQVELRVQERTAELERRNRELQEFAFIASHDLREPLRKIQTFGSLLEEKNTGRLDGQSLGYVSRMRATAHRMQELLDALLTYSRIETKGQEFKPVALNDAAQDAARHLEIIIQKSRARIEIDKLPSIMGDPYQLRHLFQNLLGNALKYARPEVRSIIKIYGEETNGKCRIFVEDNGIGFDEKYLDKIFQPFQRLHGIQEFAGTGIGLAICKKIVERHGGSITAKSTPGKGSIFIVSLPVKHTETGL